MSKKLFRIEMITDKLIWANSKEEAIEKWEWEYSDDNPDNWNDYHFNMTGEIYEVEFVSEKKQN